MSSISGRLAGLLNGLMSSFKSSERFLRVARAWDKIVDLGCTRVEPEYNERVRRSNLIAAALASVGSVYVGLYFYFGLTLLANLILVSVIGSLGVIALNASGYNLVARYWQSYLFTVSIMTFSITLGYRSGTTLLMCPALAVVFLNFSYKELRSLLFVLVTTSAIALGTDFYLENMEPILVLPDTYYPWLRVASHSATFILLFIELFIFVKSLEKSRRAAASSLQLTAEILEAVSDAFIYLNRHSKIQYVNPTGKKIFDALGLDKPIGLNFLEVSEKYETGTHCERLRKAIVGQVPYHEEYFEPLMSSWFEVRSNPGPMGTSISYRDVSARKIAENQLIQASKMSSLGEMAGAIAHEINNPMTIIQLSAEQLEIAAMDEVIDRADVSKAAERIGETVSRITKIIRGLKNFSRNSEADPMVATPVRSLIEDTIELCQERFKNKGVVLKLGEIVEANVLCRPTELTQVFLNLIGNAYDAIEERKGDRWVEVSASVSALSEGHLVSVKISDCGNGIPEAIAKRILEPFFTTKGVGKGTGLGLSISKRIVETHGGRIYLDHEKKNTTFVVELKAEAYGQSTARAS